MLRDHTPINRATLLGRIREKRGPIAADTARNMLDFANTIGCQEVPGHSSISIRLNRPEQLGLLTLYLISESGTFFVGWLERWADAGADPSLAVAYETNLKNILGVDRLVYPPTWHTKAVPLELIAAHDDEIRAAIRTTARELRRQVL